jgi:hypothetical protein
MIARGAVSATFVIPQFTGSDDEPLVAPVTIHRRALACRASAVEAAARGHHSVVRVAEIDWMEALGNYASDCLGDGAAPGTARVSAAAIASRWIF